MTYVSFVADDLTGASDVLAQAHRHGLDAVLVIGDGSRPLPTDCDVVGIAGPSRSLGGTAFDELVRAQLEQIATADAQVLIYKVCSTFDSAPARGSIGRGIELLHERFPHHGPVAIAPAQPGFGRFTAFSNHFAGYSGGVYRLDRHPVMAQHPSTPMHEADLRQVIAEQLCTGEVPGAIHLPAYADGSFGEQWMRLRRSSRAAFVVDAVEDRHLDTLALALREDNTRQNPAIVVGSGGVMAALARTATERSPVADGAQPASGPVLAVSASVSSTTAAQIADAVTHGWAELAVPTQLLNGQDPSLLNDLEKRSAAWLTAGRNVIVHTTRGIQDPRYAAAGPLDAFHVGEILGSLAKNMAVKGLTRDIAVLGGDTSSHALLSMGVSELRVATQFVTAAPVCRTDSEAAVAGCRLLLKGGQVGPVDVLERFAQPHPST
ncbi:four-carbon acid sugar kinase family protein [Streptomyces sp. ME19-01-6]|uniref:four-carbon acid sugar kinase family protein n=1 Tax=Streptomyces sp. ME19-01-6 TaxID=3028686 RepID=UPI0029AD4BD1|nr:four-carbon acid sugar kinase family protein [Streptomyces sp. ME19-01-6]MDX3233206.1 four-carbon acid sugar kinase family protein [Streptomyces sp. ME19-01-6]